MAVTIRVSSKSLILADTIVVKKLVPYLRARSWSASYRQHFLPDGDRLWAATGVQYNKVIPSCFVPSLAVREWWIRSLVKRNIKPSIPGPNRGDAHGVRAVVDP